MPATYPDLFILRHGQTEWNAANRMQGGLDSPLTALGRAQAARQRAILQPLALEGVTAISSPQGRAFATAEIALSGLVPAIRTDDRLAEIRVGTWEGRNRAEIPELAGGTADEDGALAAYDLAPGGEGFSGLRARCRAFLADLDGPAVLVTHGITSRMLRLVTLGLDDDALGRIGGGQGVVFRIRDGRQDCLD